MATLTFDQEKLVISIQLTAEEAGTLASTGTSIDTFQATFETYLAQLKNQAFERDKVLVRAALDKGTPETYATVKTALKL